MSTRRVDDHDAGELLAAVGGEAQAQRAAHGQADRDDGVVLGRELVEGPLDGRHPVRPGDLVQSCQRVPWPGSSGISTAYPRAARSSAHGRIEAGLPVKPCTTSTPTRRPPVSVGLRGGGHRRDQGGVEGCGLRAAEGDPHGHSVHQPGSREAPASCRRVVEVRAQGAWKPRPRYRRSRESPGGREPHRARVARDRRELRRARCAGRPVGAVGRGGARPRGPVPGAPASPASPPAADLPEHLRDDDEVERREQAIAKAERFRPPPAPPFPVPRTWQRGLAWAGVFVAPLIALRDRSVLDLRPPAGRLGAGRVVRRRVRLPRPRDARSRPATPGTTAHGSEPRRSTSLAA